MPRDLIKYQRALFLRKKIRYSSNPFYQIDGWKDGLISDIISGTQ